MFFFLLHLCTNPPESCSACLPLIYHSVSFATSSSLCLCELERSLSLYLPVHSILSSLHSHFRMNSTHLYGMIRVCQFGLICGSLASFSCWLVSLRPMSLHSRLSYMTTVSVSIMDGPALLFRHLCLWPFVAICSCFSFVLLLCFLTHNIVNSLLLSRSWPSLLCVFSPFSTPTNPQIPCEQRIGQCIG